MKLLLFTLFVISTTIMAENKLVLYNTPSPFGLDWSSPTSLAKDAAKNYFAAKLLPFIYHKRYIGHVNVEVSCNGRREFTGMSAINMMALKHLWQGKGLGILYHSFDGKLEPKETWNEIKEYLDEGLANFIEYKISESTCKKLLTYLDEYKSKGISSHYGLVHRPLHGEGAGCSAFGVSFLEVAGLMKEEYKQRWSNIVKVPLQHAGPPLNQEPISMFSLIFSKVSWARADQKSKTLFYWSPDLMFDWVKEKAQQTSSNFKVKVVGKSKGLVINAVNIQTSSQIWKKQNINQVLKPDLTLIQNF